MVLLAQYRYSDYYLIWNIISYHTIIILICGSDLPLTCLSGGLLFTFQSPVHLLLPPWSQSPPPTAITEAVLLSPACPPSWVLDPSLRRHAAGNMCRLLLVTFTLLMYLCVLSDPHRVWHVGSVISMCSRKKGREEGKEEGRRDREESTFLLLFQGMLKIISTSKGWVYWSTFLRYWTELLLTATTTNQAGGERNALTANHTPGGGVSMPRGRPFISGSFTFPGLTDKFIWGIHQVLQK